ncbi:hypothetical protein OM076_42740 [Solirubrobacter ginsenosidimutans]|uniref:Uncharacterized protein n=2 Tax=Solirubrobacter ginsenosidimutans TaxID=490573 RepID=A0A9X3S8J4_9ACTN|nr:hypothetical protein [Solirubrobacter ginsenosidimutans]
MTPNTTPVQPRTAPELRAQRLGSALRSLAADLVDERRNVARLRREIADLTQEIADLTARLECRAPTPSADPTRPR